MVGRIPVARLVVALLLATTWLGPPASAATASEPAADRYEYRRSRDPAGLGKFYMGREIAHYMSHLGAPWLERPEREREERTDLLLESLEIGPGDVVADVGAGSGYFTLPLAERVGPRGRVLAVDIQQEMLDIIERRAAKGGLENVVTLLGSAEDPGLPAGEVDLALLVDVYHELSHPWEMTDAIVRALRPGGLLVLVEYRGENPWVPIKALHKMTADQARREMVVHDLEFVDNLDRLPRQHVLRFRKPGAR